MFKQVLPSGKVRYGEWYTDPLTDKRKQIWVTITPSGRKKADETAASAALRAKIQGSGNTGRITLKEMQDQYIKYQSTRIKKQTVRSYRIHLNTIVRLLGPDTLADRLSAPYVAERLDTKPVTYNERLCRFKQWIRWGYRMDLIDDIGYLDKLEPKKAAPARVKDAQKYLEHDEIARLLGGMKVERWKLLTEFLLLSGLRVGEAIALLDSDVDADVIHVTKTFSLTVQEVSTTKTETSTRDVDIQPELADCISRIRTFVRKDEMAFGYRSDIFFPGFRGGYIHYEAFEVYFRENSEKCLGRRLTPHALRHTHTAMLAEAEVPLETISRRLGHADSKVTKDVYMHVTENMRQKDREKLLKVSML